jgi:Zn-dependent protease with chaperone function
MNYRSPQILIFLFLVNFITAQETPNQYTPNNLDSLKVYLKRINTNHIKRINGSYASKIKKYFKDRDEKILELIEDSVYVFNSKMEKDLNLVLEHIYASNKNIDPKDFKFFIKNSSVPNAACYGDGMFEINLGLFAQLESNDELAFVICHEIAHKLLEHPLKGIARSVSLINSKKTKKKIRDIKRNRYGQVRAALSVIDELSIDILDHSKEVEAEADSLGFVLFSNTKYSKEAALCSLGKLKRVNEMVFHHDVKIDSVFNFENYPFKSYWLKEATSLFDSEEVINEFSLASDTLKTHPEIEFRVEKLKKDFAFEKSEAKLSLSDNAFKPIKNESQIRIVQSTCDLKQLDLSIYQLIDKYDNREIAREYYVIKMAEVLKLIYKAVKAHELGKYVPQKNSFSDEKQLNKIRQFLHNLELNEIKKIGLAFCETNSKNIETSSGFNTLYNFFKTINK